MGCSTPSSSPLPARQEHPPGARDRASALETGAGTGTGNRRAQATGRLSRPAPPPRPVPAEQASHRQLASSSTEDGQAGNYGLRPRQGGLAPAQLPADRPGRCDLSGGAGGQGEVTAGSCLEGQWGVLRSDLGLNLNLNSDQLKDFFSWTKTLLHVICLKPNHSHLERNESTIPSNSPAAATRLF